MAAYSGGPDSTAMVSVLNSLPGWDLRIICAYYDHGLRSRGELDREIEIVKKFASENNLELKIGAAEGGALKTVAAEENLSVEEAARDARYFFLEEAAAAAGADYIATGHHQDDNAETMLMRFLQNSGVAGLSGIPRIRGNIIRPLSGIGKELIDRLISDEELECSLDKTNNEQDFLRNKLRHQLVPVIKEVIPEFSGNMYSLSGKVGMYNSFIEEECEKHLIWSETGDGWKIRSEIFFSQHPLLRIQSVYGRLNRLRVETGRVKFTALESTLGGSSAVNGKVLLRTAGFEVVCRNDYIFIQRLVNHNKKSYLLYLKPDEKYNISGQIFQMHCDSEPDSLTGNPAKIAVSEPLIIRSFREGDRINIGCGRKSIKKLFNEWKVSEDERSLIPIVEDTDGIAAVMGRHLGYADKYACGRETAGEKQRDVLLDFSTVTETTGERPEQ